MRRGCSERVIGTYLELYGEPEGFHELAKQISRAEYAFLRREYGYSHIWAKDYAKHTFKVLEIALERIYSDKT